MYDSNRENNLKNVLSILPGFDQKPLSDNYLTEGIKRLIPGGYEKGKEVHHVTGLDIASPLLYGRSLTDKANIGRALHQQGVRYGNDMYNLAMLDRISEHLFSKDNWQTSDTVHSVLARNGIEDRLFVGDERIRAQQFYNSLTQLPTSVIINEVVPVFAEYIAGPSMEAAKKHNPNVTTLEENKRIFNEVEIPAERRSELQLHNDEIKAEHKLKQDQMYDNLARTDLDKPATVRQKLDQVISDVKSDGLLSSMVEGNTVKHQPAHVAKQRARAYASQRKSEGQQSLNLQTEKHLPKPRTDSLRSSAKSKARVWSVPMGAVVQL